MLDRMLAKIPDTNTLDAIDDDLKTGNRPIAVTMSIAEWKMLRMFLEMIVVLRGK